VPRRRAAGRDAGAIFGGGVLLALQDMQEKGIPPAPGSPAWDEFAARAEAGDVELAIVVMVRDRGPLCTDRWPASSAVQTRLPRPSR
jgi:hypothetical protein